MNIKHDQKRKIEYFQGQHLDLLVISAISVSVISCNNPGNHGL